MDFARFVDHLLELFSILLVVVFLATVFQMLQHGFNWILAIELVLLAVLLFMLNMTGLLSKKVRVAAFLIATMVIASSFLVRNGLGPVPVTAICFVIMMAALLAGSRYALALMAVQALIFSAVGVAFVRGWLTAAPDLAAFSADPVQWFIAGGVATVVSLVLILAVHSLVGYWKGASKAALRESEQAQALVENAPEAIVIYDLDTELVTAMNPMAEELFGARREEIIGRKSATDLSPPVQPDGVASRLAAQRHFQRALDGQVPKTEWVVRRPDGKEIPCDVSLSRLPPADRRLIRASLIDIRDRKSAQARQEELQTQLAQSQKLQAVGKLTGGVAHDFNNLLAVILGNLELLQEGEHDDEQTALIEAAIGATRKGAELTSSMLRYARRAPLEPQVLDLNAVVRETRNWTTRTIPKTIAVETSLLAGLWPIEADPGATESALLNLILNARDAMPNGGRLTIETNNVRIDGEYIHERNEEVEPGRYVMLAVSDTGTGIPAEVLDRIFDPFFTTKPPGTGSGLGLSMIEGFLKQSGGTVRVYTEPGRGTTFKLYFRACENLKLEPPKPPEVTIGATGGQKILVVEDEPQVLDVLIAVLDRAGYAAHGVTTGDEAQSIFLDDPGFDLVLTDIVMPGELQGPTLARSLRDRNPDLPVVFMSGYAAEATVHGNGLRPEDIRLMKPVRRVELLQAVATALGTAVETS
ncbi:ATP-binding protein [Pseudoruegeria sp. HB172150]|uniref:ATP-binding protein n=1 Tax=Pseudoruegeria sp. HB172150 TaxID=2721164 RepID=UPI001C12D776|nr:ATP-binding protein [Pseudoruegeria sp. HB172150]